MPRMPRFFLPGTPLHVVQRGNNRAAIFIEDPDRAFAYGCIQHAAGAHGVRIHAYVFMTNHIHLLVTPDAADSVPKMMHKLGRLYVDYFNRNHRRTGTLWEGRYKAAIIEDERYLLTCMRYIELNPVRAGMVESPGDYGWSSLRANAWGARDRLLSAHSEYVALGHSDRARRAAYRELFGGTLAEEEIGRIRDATQHAWALGGDSFRSRVTALSRRAERLPLGRPCTAPAKVESDPISSEVESDPTY
jgi:putative transposase